MHTMETIKNRNCRSRIFIPLCDETELAYRYRWMTAISVRLPLKGGGTEDRIFVIDTSRAESCLYKKDFGRYEQEAGSGTVRRVRRKTVVKDVEAYTMRFACSEEIFQWEFCSGGYKPPYFPPEAAGVIGCDFLSAHALALDFGADALYSSPGMTGLHPKRLGYFFRFEDRRDGTPAISVRVGGKKLSCRLSCGNVSMMRLQDIQKDGFVSRPIADDEEEFWISQTKWYEQSFTCADGSGEFRRPRRVKFTDTFCCFEGFCCGLKVKRNEIWLGHPLMRSDGAVIDFGIGAFYKLKYRMGSEINC